MKSGKTHAALVALIAFFAFANSLGGDFVYDDDRQILMNPTIQQPHLYGKALTSDVWAFKGDGTVAASNYYRPVFVFWMITNFALFGANPFGWHLLNVALHVFVCLLALAVLRRCGFEPAASFVLSAVFAVHPVHVENVAWISGSPDILLSLFFLSSLLVLPRSKNKGTRWHYASSLAFYGLAQGTKEIAILLFPLYFLAFRIRSSEGSQAQLEGVRDAMIHTVPYAVLAGLFFVARWFVIGGVTHPVEDAPNFVQSILTVPSVFLFYLLQMVFPIFLAENYPLRPEMGFTLRFFASAAASGGVLLLLWWICKGNAVRRFGALLFLGPILPALYIAAFPSEQIVHDRYLYLSLLGFLMVTGSYVFDKLRESAKALRVAGAVSIAIIVLLGIQTIVYNRVWSSNHSLWEYNVKADPNSAASFAQFASELSDEGQYAEAISAYDRSIQIKETPLALMGRARNLIARGRYDEAVADTEKVIKLPNEQANAYVLYQAYEAAAIAFSSSNRPGEAEKLVRSARDRLPIYRAALTDKLAIILYNQGKKHEALDELDSVREQARRELLPASKAVFLRLGVLETEAGDRVAAVRDLNEYLDLSTTFTDGESINLRREAAAALSRLR